MLSSVLTMSRAIIESESVSVLQLKRKLNIQNWTDDIDNNSYKLLTEQIL